jgi:dTDP-4-dehydrorhamnose 3,5-epimerase-like enzyme
MERIETSLPGVYELRPVVHRDSRGAFLESPVLSQKDANNPKLADVPQQFLPQYSPK